MSSHNPVIARKIVETGLIQVVLFAVNPAYDMQPANEDLELLWAAESYVNPLHNIDPDRDAFHKLCALNGVGTVSYTHLSRILLRFSATRSIISVAVS